MSTETPTPAWSKRLVVDIHGSHYERLIAEAARRTSPARRVTVSDIVRELIDSLAGQPE